MSSKGIRGALGRLALGSLLLIPQAVHAQGDPNAAPAQGGNARDPVAIYIQAGATADQVQKIRDMSRQFEDMGRVRWQTLMNLQQKMRGLSLQPDPDEKTVLSTQDEINKVMAEMSTERIKLMLQIRGILTPDQKERLVAIMKERQSRTAGPQGGQ